MVFALWCCFFFKQKTAYEMRISDWSSDVCASDLGVGAGIGRHTPRDAEQAGVPPLLLGEEDRDAFLDDLTEIAALDQIDIALPPRGLRRAIGRGGGRAQGELRDAPGRAAQHLGRAETDQPVADQPEFQRGLA